MRAIVYVRVSTEEQARHGWSIDAQIDEIRRYAKQNSIELVKEYIDRGFSGSAIDRPQLLEMLNDIKTLDIQALLVWRVDRLSRDPDIYSFVKLELLRHDIKIISTTEAFDDTPIGEFMEGLLVNLAKLETSVLSVRTKLGMKKRLEAGGWVGKPPLGYKAINTGDKKELIKDPDVAPYIRDIFQYYSTGKYSFNDISLLMKKKGFTSLTDKSYTPTRIKSILENEFYIGKVSFSFYNYERTKEMKRRKRKKGKIAETIKSEGKHEPLIDKFLFERVQRTIAQNGYDFSTRKRELDFVLRGLLWCDECNKKLTAERHIAKNVEYYRCIPERGTPTCKQSYIKTQDLEQQVEELMQEIQIKPEKLKLYEYVVKTVGDEINANIKEERESIKKRLVELERRENRLVDELSDGVMKKEDFQRHYGRVKDERDTLERRLDTIEPSYINNLDTISRYIHLASKLSNLWKHFDMKNRKLLLKSIIKRIYVRDKQILKDKLVLTPVFEWINQPHSKKVQKLLDGVAIGI